MYADLHCHPTLYAFNRFRNQPRIEADPSRFHPWADVPASIADLAKGKQASSYPQCTFAQMTAGRLRLAFTSLTPIEKGFLRYADDASRGSFAGAMARLLSGYTLTQTAINLVRGDRQRALREALGLLRADGPLRLLLQKMYTRYDLSRLRFLVSEDYDYWEEFWAEYRFLLAKDGQRESGRIHAKNGVNGKQIEGTYHVIRDVEQLRQLIEGSESDLAAILSIEGAHVLAIAADESVLPLQTIRERIAALKTMQHPIFYITLAHHFDNGICGHARSIPDVGQAVISQRRRIDQDLERAEDRGLTVLRDLLDLDDDLNDRGQRRILVDIKHMSPRSRRSFYREIITPYLDRYEARQAAGDPPALPKIPLIASHMAYAGVDSLQTLIDNVAREGDQHHVNDYYAWGINLCDEDIRMILRSEGLIGLILDQRVAGVTDGGALGEAEWAEVFYRQILGVVDVVYRDSSLSGPTKRKIWDCLCIGSDFDGMINPFSAFPTVLEYDRLMDALRGLLASAGDRYEIATIGVDRLLEKLAWENAYQLLLRHFPRAAA